MKRWLGAAILALALPASPAAAATLFGLVDTGELFASTDDGAAWTVRSALPVYDAVGLAARESPNDLYLVSAGGTVYRSNDGGVNWTAVGAVSAPDVVDLLIAGNGDLLLLTASGTVHRSADLGVTWSAVGAIAASGLVSLTDDLGGELFALAATGEVYASADGGASWSARGALAVANAVAVRALGDVLYLLTDTGEVARSADSGANWTVIGAISQVGMRGFAAAGNKLYAAVREGEVALSADGASWNWQGAINQLSVIALATDAPQVDAVGSGVRTAPLALAPPWPNPGRAGGEIFVSFDLPRDDTVELELHDARGRRLAHSARVVYPAGRGLAWRWRPDGSLRAGVYWVRLRTGSGASVARRWVLLP